MKVKDLYKGMRERDSNIYLNSLALLETIITNKKEVMEPLVRDGMKPDEIRELTKLVRAMRSELKQVLRISMYSRSQFKTLLCRTLRDNLT